MKKVFVILMGALILTGCGMSDKEKEEMFYESLEKAYISTYVSDGIGLAVYASSVENIDGTNWYLVAVSEYGKLNKLTSLANDVYDEELAEKINQKIDTKYKEIDGKLYTTSTQGCTLDYQFDENLLENLKKDIKIKKNGWKTITFEYKGKELKAKRDGDNYKFESKVFKCNEEE